MEITPPTAAIDRRSAFLEEKVFKSRTVHGAHLRHHYGCERG
jgi:hypothetical protein